MGNRGCRQTRMVKHPRYSETIATFPRFNCNPKWHQPKPDFPELNRDHKDAYIHYEASAEGLDFASAWEPQYQGKIRSDPTPTGMLVGSNSSNEIPTEYYLLPAIMGDEENSIPDERVNSFSVESAGHAWCLIFSPSKSINSR